MSRQAKEKPHYVNNKELFSAMVNWKEEVTRAVNDNETPPSVTPYIAECFVKIANGLSHRPNFIGYSYRDEMIMDGVENCLQYADRFNPEKSKNPFSYFTQIIYFAFLRRIEREKKQSRIKDRMLKMGVENYARMEGDYTSYSIEPPSEIFVINDNDPPTSPKPIQKKNFSQPFLWLLLG